MSEKRFISLQEAAQLYGLSRGFFYKKTSAKEIPHFKIGKQCMFDPTELDEWMHAYTRVEAVR